MNDKMWRDAREMIRALARIDKFTDGERFLLAETASAIGTLANTSRLVEALEKISAKDCYCHLRNDGLCPSCLAHQALGDNQG